MPPRPRIPWPLVGVLVLAAGLRLWRIGAVPPGFQFDEAHNAIDAARVLAGQLRLFFPDNGGREPLNVYLMALSLAAFGREHVVVAIRLVSALVGIASVAMLYRFASRFLHSRWSGLLASAFLAVNYWHLHFSRYAIRAIFAPLWTTAALWAWWRAVSPPPPADPAPPNAPAPPHPGDSLTPSPAQRERGLGGEGLFPTLSAVLCGIFLALAVYSHPSGRLLPVILIAHAVYRTFTDRRAARAVWRVLLVAGMAAAVLFLPLGSYFMHHPGQFTAHPSDVSLQAVADAAHGGSLIRALAANAWAIGGMLFVAGDPSTFHNLPGLPVFDPLSALCAVIGLGVVAGWLVGRDRDRRERAAFLAVWMIVGLVPTLLSDRPPNYSRAMVALPAIVLLAAVGLTWLLGRALGWSNGGAVGWSNRGAAWRPDGRAARVSTRFGRRGRPGSARIPGGIAATVVAVAAAWTGYHYFVAFPRLPHVYYSYDVDKIDAFRALDALARDANVFLHPLWADHATFASLNAAGRIRPLDGRDTLVLAADGRDTVVAFPAKEAEREGWYASAGSLYGDVATTTWLTDALGAPLLAVLRVPASARGDLAVPRDAPLEPATFVDARFADAVRLVGLTSGPVRAGEPLSIVLVWQSLAPVDRDLTVFVHLLGPGGEPVGQADGEPGHASWRTSRWRPGDVVVDRATPVVAAETEGPVTIEIGWYDGASGERLRTADDRDAVTIGPLPVVTGVAGP